MEIIITNIINVHFLYSYTYFSCIISKKKDYCYDYIHIFSTLSLKYFPQINKIKA